MPHEPSVCTHARDRFADRRVLMSTDQLRYNRRLVHRRAGAARNKRENRVSGGSNGRRRRRGRRHGWRETRERCQVDKAAGRARLGHAARQFWGTKKVRKKRNARKRRTFGRRERVDARPALHQVHVAEREEARHFATTKQRGRVKRAASGRRGRRRQLNKECRRLGHEVARALPVEMRAESVPKSDKVNSITYDALFRDLIAPLERLVLGELLRGSGRLVRALHKQR